MKALFKVLFLGMVTSGLLVACAKSGNSGTAPLGYNPYGYYDQAGTYGYNQYPYDYQGTSQILDSGLFKKYLLGQFCIKFFGSSALCHLVNGAPAIELQVSDLTFAQALTPAKLIIHVQQSAGWQINGTSFPKEEIYVSLRKINNNTQFEAIAIDPISGNGVGGRLAIRGTGLPAAVSSTASLPVDVLYDGQPMLRATLTRYR